MSTMTTDSVWMSYEQYIAEKEWLMKAERRLVKEMAKKFGAGPLTRFVMSTIRQQQEKELEDKYLNQIVSFNNAPGKSVLGKVMRLSVWPKDGVEQVRLTVNNNIYTCDLEYFEDNIKIL